MNSTAALIAVAYTAVTVIGVGLFLFLWRSTTKPKEVDAKRLAHRESTWLLIVVIGLLALLFATIFVTPYGESAPPGSQVVEVESAQFAFILKPNEVRAGEPVAFQLRSSDVNHGFGVYTENDEFVLQAQVVPDFTTTVVHTFDEPGTYKVLCLEYCGLDHHKMVARFEVTP
jgi:cytochrome c oxidase subunit 2